MSITPGPGYMIDPNNPNGVIPIGSASTVNNPNAALISGGTSAASSTTQPYVPPTNYGAVSTGTAPSTPTPTPTQGGYTNTQQRLVNGQWVTEYFNASGLQTSDPTDYNNAHQPPAPPPPVQVPTPIPTPPQQTPPVTPTQPTTNTPQTQTGTSTGTTPPQTNLAPGSTGADVQKLQDYLVQHGYMTQAAENTGPGTYGPQTTMAVQKMQEALGMNPVTGSGSYGPQTQQALAQKYQGIFNSKSGSAAPQNGADAYSQTSAMGGGAPSMSTSDPVIGSYIGAMAPIMQSLQNVLSNINNPALTAISLQQEYDQMRQQYNLPEMQASMLNMQNIMNGTVQDIRDEVNKSGGFATESQVQGIAATRNTVLLKQYNALSSQYTAAQNNVDNMMKYATQDQQTQLQRQQASASVTESMASISNAMMTMGMSMQKNARDTVQYNVTQMGYRGLAESAQGNPQMLSYYENMLGLSPGTLSDPHAVAGMDTYKNQQLIINQYRASAQGFNVGYSAFPGTGGNGTPSIPGVPTAPGGQVGITPVDPSTLIRPSSVGPNIPLIMTADQMQKYMDGTGAKYDPGTQNVVANGTGYYVHQSDGSYVLKSALPSPVDSQYSDIQRQIAAAPNFTGSATQLGKYTRATNSALSGFKDTGTYKIVSNVAPYLEAIRAAVANPNDKSISDFELLDSFVKAAKGGTGQVTDSQISVMLKGKSISDSYSTLEQKIQQGGVLSIDQRTAIASLAEETYKRNLSDYQNLYVQAIQTLSGNGVPANFWRQLPDFNNIIGQ